MNIELLTIQVLEADGTSYSPMLVDGSTVELLEYSYVSSRMGTTSLTSTLKHAKCLDDYWTGREFVDFRGVRLYLDRRPGSSKDNTDARYVHQLEFRAGRDILLSGVYFCDAVAAGAASAGKPQSNSYDVKFFGTLDEFVQRFNDVLSYRGLSSRFSVSLEAGVAGTTESLELEFSNVTLFEALQKAVETWEVPFYFSGDSAVFGSADSQALVGVEYGGDRQLLSVSMNARGEKIVTRISGSGGSDNVPYYYPNPSPKGTLGVGGTATGVTVVDQYLFGQKVGLSDTLTYTGRAASFGGITLAFGGQTAQNAPGGVAAVVEDVDVTSGVSYPFRVTVSADVSGGFDRDLRVPLYANVGNTQQLPGNTTLYYVKSAWGGQGTEYVPKEGSEVAAKGWEMTVDRVEVSFGSSTKQVDFGCVYTEVEMTEADRALYPERKLTAVVLDFAEVLSSFPSGVSLSQCSVTIVGHLASHVLWQVGTGSGSPAGFFCETMSATGAFDPCGWYLGDESIGEDLSVVGLSQSGSPVEGSTVTQTVVSYITPTGRLMPGIYRTSGGASRFYDAENGTYIDPETGDYYEFENEYDPLEPHEHVEDFEEVVPSIRNLQDGSGNPLNVLQDVYFDDGYNTRDLLPDGQTLKYQWFFVKLKPLGFNLFDCAIEDGEMAVVMSDGPCAGCHFKILVTTAGKNPVQKNNNGTLKKVDGFGVIDPDNIQASQQDTTSNDVWVALYLDDSTFGGTEVEYGVMPAYDKATGAGPKPVTGDAYTLENILLPQAFFTAAEEELDRRLIAFMAEHNAEKYDPSVAFSRIWLAHNPSVRSALSERSRLSLTYDGKTYSPLYVSQFTLEVKEGDALPEIRVETSDIVEARSSGLDDRIDAAVDSALNVVKGELGGGAALEETDRRYLRKDVEDRAKEKITFEKGLEVGEYKPGFGGIGGTIYTNAAGEAIAEVDFLNVRRKATFTQVEIDQLRKVNGTILLSLAEMKCSAVEAVTGGWKCFFKSDAEDGSAIENGFAVGDLAICQTYRNNNTHYYWRKVIGAGADYITLSDANGEYAENSDAPEPGDVIVQLGNVSDTSRQSAQILDCYGADSPSYVVYAGINSFSLSGKDIFGVVYRETSSGSGVYQPNFFNYGPMLLGDRAKTNEYIEFDGSALNIKGRLTVRKSDGSYESMSTYIADQKTLTDSLQAQIDGQIESFEGASAPLPQLVNGSVDYSTANSPASGWTTDTERAKHVGDIFADNSTGHLYRYTRQSASPQRYYWTLVQDEEIAQVVTGLSQLQYLKVATNGGTLVDGGLVLTSLIQLGMPGTGGTYNVWSGINGVINEALTDPMRSIAAWFGGPMVDHELFPSAATYAKSLLRMDGTGYFAGGNITWNADGSGSVAGGNLSWDANGVPTIAGGVEIGTSGSTIADLLAALYFENPSASAAIPAGLVRLKSDYSYLGVREGLYFDARTVPASDTNPPDLYVKMVNGQRVLYSPLPLITGGDQIVIDGTPGGGGGGTGGFLYELGDIYHKNAQSEDVQYVAHADGSRPDAGDVLTYNATKGWLAAPSSGGSGTVTSVSLAEGATNGTIHIVVDGTAQSDVAVHGLGTMAYETASNYQSKYPFTISGTSGTTYNLANFLTSAVTSIGGKSGVITLSGGLSINSSNVLSSADTKYKLTLNGTTNGDNSGTSLGTLYAPTTLSGSTYVLIGGSSAPAWTQISGLSVGTAAKLSTVSKTAWGQTYWTSGGVPDSVSGDMSSVGNVTPSANKSKNLGSSSALWAKVYSDKYYLTDTIYFYTETVNNVVCVHLNAPFITDGDQIVMSGTPGGGGTGGAGFMYELGDVYASSNTIQRYYDNVTSGNVQVGDVLVYRQVSAGTYKWAAMPISAISGTTYTAGTGITISDANAISVTANTYLPLTGGTLSNTSNSCLAVNNSGTGTSSYINYQVGGSNKARTGYDGAAGAYLQNAAVTNTPYVNIASDGVFKYKNTNVFWHDGNLTLSNGVITIGSNTITPVTDVTYDSTSDRIRVTKGGSTSNVLVGFATTSKRFARYVGTNESGGFDLNTLLTGGGITYNYGSAAYWANGPTGMTYGGVLQLNNNGSSDTLAAQLAWDVVHTSSTVGDTGKIWWRDKPTAGWGTWHLIYDSVSLTKSVITGLLGNEYHPYGGGEAIDLSASNLTAYKGLTAYNAAKTYRLNFNFPTTGNDLTVGRIYNVTEDGQTVGDLNIQSGLIYCVGASRVGINTSTPSSSYRLDVNGNVGVTGSLTTTGNITMQGTDRAIYMGAAGSEKQVMRLVTSSYLLIGSGTYDTLPTIIYGTPIRFYTNNNGTGAEMMRLLANGTLLIGATSLPSGTTAKLYVNGATYLNGNATIPTGSSLTIGGATISWVTSGNSGYLKINTALLTEGDQIVNSGTPGGGGTGGAGNLYELNDVLTDTNKTKVKRADGSTNAANGDMLVFNGTKWYALAKGNNLSIRTTSGINYLDATNTEYTFTNADATLAWGTRTKIATTGGTDIYVTMPANPNTDEKVKVNSIAPSSGTWYYPVWYTSTSGTGNVNANDGLRYYSLQGTTSANGRSIIAVGNSTNSGTAGNKYGEVWIYSKNTNVGCLVVGELTGTRSYTFPNVSGTVALTSTTLSGYGITDAKIASGVITLGSNTITPVTAVAVGTGDNATKLGITAGGSTNYITVPYATHANYLDVVPVTADAQLVTSGVRAYQGPGNTSWDGVSTMNYAGILSFGYPTRGWQIWAARGNTGLYWRNGLQDGTAWADERLIYDSYTLTKSVLTTLLEGSNGYYVKKSGDTMSGALTMNFAGVYGLYFNNSASGGTASGIRFQVGGTTKGAIYVTNANALYFNDGTGDRTVWHSANSNLATVDWTCKILKAGTTTAEWSSQVKTDNSLVYSAHGNGYGLSVHSKTTTQSTYLLMLRYGQTTLGSAGSYAMFVGGDGNVGIGTETPAAKLEVLGEVTITRANGTSLVLQGNSANTNSGEIIFRGRKTSTTGFKIAGEYPSGTPLYDRQNLTIYASDATDAVTWVQALQITRSADVIIGTSAVNKTLTVNGATTITGTLDLGTSSSAALNFKRTSVNYITAPASGYFAFVPNGAATQIANAPLVVNDALVCPGKSTTTLGSTTYPWQYGYFANAIYFTRGGTYNAIINSTKNSGFDIYTTANTDDATAAVAFRLDANKNGRCYGSLTRDGYDIHSRTDARIYVWSANTSNAVIALRAYSGNYLQLGPGTYTTVPTIIYGQYIRFLTYNTSSTSVEAIRIIRSGYVGIGTTSPTQKLHVDGTILSTGDQVVNSDATLKKDWRPLNYGISDIAKATAGVFTWKDGKGISAGTKAQDWEKLVPQLVHGEEGHKSLAYGQIAMLNTILLARGYESHEERIKRLEARVAELELENEQLRAN